MLKKIILGILFVIGIIGGTTLVFGTNFVFSEETYVKNILSPNIYLWEKEHLSSTIIWYESTVDIRDAQVYSSCNTRSEFVEKHESIYYFSLTYIGEKCNNETIVLQHGGKKLLQTSMQLHIVTKSDIFTLLTDYPTKDITKLYKSLGKTLKKYAFYKNVNSESVGKYITYKKRQRKYQESLYQRDIAEKIIYGRSKKYISPVPEKSLSKEFSKIPNAGRPYRQAYTDGIHHWWDIDGEIWEEIVAIDDGVIIRIVDGFQYSDLGRIVYGENLSYEQKLKNLDVLRGNQVWLKTTKGEVIFYSHLDSVYDYIREGDMITRSTPLWTMWVTGVPEKDYDDYHLHFALQVNPYDHQKAGTYNFDDYMTWDWKFRGETFEYILQNQGEIFE